MNDRLVGGERRHESLPAQTTWDFGRATWLLERDRGAGLARRRTRAAQRAESMVWWLRQNCVFSGTLRCALLQSEGLYSPARTNLGLAMLWLRKNGRRLYADDSYETLRLGAL